MADLADKIQSVDTRGSKGINISARLDDLDQELTRIAAELDAFEATNDLNIDVDLEGLSGEVAKVRSQLAALRASESFDMNASIQRNIGIIPQGGAARRSMGDISSAFDLTGGGPSFDSKLIDSFRSFRRSMNSARGSISQFDLRMTDMHNMLARVVPLLLVFIGAIPAVVTALVGLAAAAVAAGSALLAIAGFGALGVGMEGGEFNMDNLSDVIDDLRRDFLDAFAPLAERLEPLFLDAADAMTLFFNAVSQQGDSLMELTDEARGFGQFMMEWVPDVLAAMAAMAEAFAPVFGAMGDALQDAQVLRTLTELTMEAIPAIAQMADIIIEMIPSLIRMSIGFTIVANTVMDALGAIGSFLRMLGISPEVFGLVTGGVLALTSAYLLLKTSLSGVIGLMAGKLIGTLMSVFYSTLLLNKGIVALAINTIAKAIVSIYGYITSLLGAQAATMSMASATMIAAGALAAFLTLATLGALGAVLVPMATAAASRFTILGNSIQGATDSLKEFDRVSGQTDSAFNPYSGGGSGSSAPTAAGGITGPSGNVIIESSGDGTRDRSNARNMSWREGRTTGSQN